MDTIVENAQLQQEMESLRSEVKSQAALIAKLEILVKYYEEQFLLSKRRQFGASSEQSPDQLRFENLFNEVEDQADPSLPEPTYEEVTYKRKKRVGKREDDLSGLPVERIDYELDESERGCPECGNVMNDIGVTIRDELVIIPAQVIHREHATHTYACPNCQKNSDHTPIERAEAPMPLICNSLASPSAVAHLAVQKYVNGVPLYRQEKGFTYDGVVLSRQTMANWLVYCARNYLIAIHMMLIQFLLKEGILHCDETPVQVLHEPGREAKSKSYEWLYRTSGYSEHKIVIYDYQETREYKHPKGFLKDFKGFVHSDGYEAYHDLSPNIINVGCWAHARRYWMNLYESIPEVSREGSIAERGLVYINLLFAFEDEFYDLDPEERFKKRLKYSKPVSDEFFDWVGTINALPKSLLGKAVHFALAQRVYLENVYLDGRLELSNNRAERAIKPFVQGRKQWLFSNTPNGAEASSIIYSIIETAKENNLHPFHYIKYLLETLPNIKTSELETLLPWSSSLPDCCRAPVKVAMDKRPARKNKGPLHNALVKLRERFRRSQETTT